MAGFTDVSPCTGTLLQGTSSLNCANGIIGGSVAGQANDSVLYGIYVQLNATAVSVTIGGLYDSTGAPQPLLVTGETTVDYFWMPPVPILNTKAAFTFTPSAAAKVWVFMRAYNGPERPETRLNT